MLGNHCSLSRASAVTATSIALAASALLTGCSSSGSGSVTSASGASSTGSASAAVTTSASASAKTTAGGGGHAAGSGFCQEATLAQAAQTKAAHAFNAGSPAALQKIEQQGLTELRALTATAPSAIKSDLATLLAADEKLYAALQAANFDVRKIDPTAMSGVSTPEFTKATEAISGYFSRVCGISVSPSP